MIVLCKTKEERNSILDYLNKKGSRCIGENCPFTIAPHIHIIKNGVEYQTISRESFLLLKKCMERISGQEYINMMLGEEAVGV